MNDQFIKQIFDGSDNILSTEVTGADGTTRIYDALDSLTAVIDATGVRTNYINGLISSIVGADGEVIREFDLLLDDDGNVTDVDVFGADIIHSEWIIHNSNPGPNQPSRDLVFRDGVILHFGLDENGDEKVTNITDTKGYFSGYEMDPETGKLKAVHYNDGRSIFYKSITLTDGTDRDEVIDYVRQMRGRHDFYNYDMENGDVDTVDQRKEGNRTSNLIGTVHYKKNDEGRTVVDSKGNPIQDWSVRASDGVVTRFYNDDDGDMDTLDRAVEEKSETSTARIRETVYKEDGSTIDKIYNYNAKGDEKVSRQDYTYPEDLNDPDDGKPIDILVKEYDVSEKTDKDDTSTLVEETYYRNSKFGVNI